VTVVAAQEGADIESTDGRLDVEFDGERSEVELD
jgi:hypothetical protein